MNTKNQADRQGAIAAIVADLTKAMRRELATATKTCLNCLHFDEPSEKCKLCNLRPPARVIVSGCPKHEDEIPF